MNGEITKASEVIEDLEVTEASNKNEEKIWLKLHRTFTQEDLPVDSNEVATAYKLAKWKYLDRMKDEINTDVNIEVT